MKKKKILVFSREHITNYGDPIIADCCEYLIKKVAKENGVAVETSIADVYETNEQVIEKKVSNNDIIVYPGGGLNSTKFNKNLIDIINIVERAGNKTIFINAVGLLPYEEESKNVAMLKEIFNSPSVVQVTTRGDFEALQKILNPDKQQAAKWIFDPAMWVNEAYGISKKESDVIGIGVIRAEIFQANGLDFPRPLVVHMYSSIINELEKRNKKWCMFTNGMEADHEFGLKLLAKLKRDPKIHMKHPTSKKSLVNTISGFEGVIASRMHANIIAASLDIPTIGLVWNEKLNYFGKLLNSVDNFINYPHLIDGKLIVDKLENALVSGYDLGSVGDVRARTLETFKQIVKD